VGDVNLAGPHRAGGFDQVVEAAQKGVFQILCDLVGHSFLQIGSKPFGSTDETDLTDDF
jgi:hypothetical protein